MLVRIASVLMFAFVVHSASAEDSTRISAPDYLRDELGLERVLEWGERPVWSPDGTRIAFLRSDMTAGPAYEMDLRTRDVRCLTCRWGAGGDVTRIYYLPDGSFLILGPVGLTGRETVRGDGATTDPESTFPSTELYWMPASADFPPQPLGAKASGEIALFYEPLDGGGARIAWGEMGEKSRLMTGDVVHDGSHAALTHRVVVETYSFSDPAKLASAETYDFAADGSSIVFFTVDKKMPWNGMYRIDLRDGRTTRLPTDGAHSETHLFPDDRFGLEESNRASDPGSPIRGISGHIVPWTAVLLRGIGWPDADATARRYGGRKFDLYVHDLASDERRRLTFVSDIGGEAHQSSPARDGKRIVFTMTAPKSGPYAGQGGLYIGTWR